MNISKDEARILAAIMYDEMGELPRMMGTKEEAKQLADKLTKLYDELQEFGKDKRRIGRTTQNDFHDLLKRYLKE
jgi:hypothetical protein